MDDDAVAIRLLADLGMDEMSYKALPLLPLVQVAWADGQVHDRERAVIVELARDTWQVGEEGLLLLKNWLHYPPTPAYLERGRATLATLAARDNTLGYDEALLADVVVLARTVAKAAGGLFGIGAVSRAEARALQSIAKALHVDGSPYERAQATEIVLPSPQRRVTITFSTTTFDVVAQGGVLEPDPALGGAHYKVPVTRTGLTIGSDLAADLRIEHDRSVAANHCRLFERNRKFYVEDLESSTGTFVHGERVLERRLLGGETLQVGSRASFVFKRLRRIPAKMVRPTP